MCSLRFVVRGLVKKKKDMQRQTDRSYLFLDVLTSLNYYQRYLSILKVKVQSMFSTSHFNTNVIMGQIISENVIT